MLLSFLCILSTTLFIVLLFFFLMIRRPPRSTLDRSSAASDVYKRQVSGGAVEFPWPAQVNKLLVEGDFDLILSIGQVVPVSYTHLRAHETVLDIVCRLLLEKKK